MSFDKCVRMHIKNKQTSTENGGNIECENLVVDSWELKKVRSENKVTLSDTYEGKRSIKSVENHTYLGEIVSNDLSNRNNIVSKAAKGKAAVRDILQILDGVSSGEHYFEALKLLRESMLISVLLSNLEVSFNVSATSF